MIKFGKIVEAGKIAGRMRDLFYKQASTRIESVLDENKVCSEGTDFQQEMKRSFVSGINAGIKLMTPVIEDLSAEDVYKAVYGESDDK